MLITSNVLTTNYNLDNGTKLRRFHATGLWQVHEANEWLNCSAYWATGQIASENPVFKYSRLTWFNTIEGRLTQVDSTVIGHELYGDEEVFLLDHIEDAIRDTVYFTEHTITTNTPTFVEAQDTIGNRITIEMIAQEDLTPEELSIV